MPKPRVLAVVVTHNRLTLLQRCLHHLAQQSHPADAVLVVNNASTDGTEEYLREAGVRHVTQANGGSSAGWHTGIDRALAEQFDFVWMMDDDGYPDARALETLLQAFTTDLACLSSVVVKEAAPSELVFGLPRLDASGFPTLISWKRKYYRLEELTTNGRYPLYPFAHLFNGALISADALRRIGNVDTSYVVYGDELDYLWRLNRVGRVATHTGAIHFHPDVSSRPLRESTPYYFVRNSIVLNKRYLNAPKLRSVFAIVIACARIIRRNGLLTFWSYVAGRNKSLLPTAVRHGWSGRMGPL